MRGEEIFMIRITAHHEANTTRLSLEGKLAGDAVGELERCWRVAATTKTSVSIDLTAVSFIDNRGKQLLVEMFEGGARLISKGLLARCIIEEIKEELHSA
jgi:ABC-type transporter Mla MlaB component